MNKETARKWWSGYTPLKRLKHRTTLLTIGGALIVNKLEDMLMSTATYYTNITEEYAKNGNLKFAIQKIEENLENNNIPEFFKKYLKIIPDGYHELIMHIESAQRHLTLASWALTIGVIVWSIQMAYSLQMVRADHALHFEHNQDGKRLYWVFCLCVNGISYMVLDMYLSGRGGELLEWDSTFTQMKNLLEQFLSSI